MRTLLKRLVQSDTSSEKGELAAAEIITEELSKSAIACRIDQWDGNRANITARIRSGGSKGILLFACHLDVVPPGEGQWRKPPFSGIEGDGKIFGRGSADMKGGITAAVTAIKELVDSKAKLDGDIIFFAGAGEETDSCGIKRFICNHGGQLGDTIGVVIPEPTDFEVVTAHWGMLWLEVRTAGKTAHGSSPELGVNAITSMKSVLEELEAYKVDGLPEGCSLSVNNIAGGKAINVVPDACSIGIDIRTMIGQSHEGIINDFKDIFARLKQEDSLFEAEVSVVRDVGPLKTDENCDFVRGFCSSVGIKETKTVGFCTDGSFLAALKVPVVIFGPGKPELCHKPDEYIDIADVEKAVDCYKTIILRFLS
ncbi:MAG: M20 family metallopeptidase [Planctomycetota bacterium]|jgi:succinyl-diaminopimelate desuccinylase